MIETIVEGIVEFVPRAVGWGFLKVVTFGRYRGFGDDHLLLEGGVGLGLLIVVGFVAYRAWAG